MINKILACTLIISLLFLALTATAQEGHEPLQDVKGFKRDLQKASKSTKSIACDFVQQRHLSMMTQAIESKGRFWFKRPASIRWEYDQPYAYRIILSGRKAYVQGDEESREFDTESNAMFQNLGEIMFSFILGDLSKAEDNYHITYSQTPDHYHVKLVPATENVIEGLNRIEMYFDKQDYSLAQIIMKEQESDFTQIYFINRVLNSDLDDELFEPGQAL